jgi:hypothetical protein
MHFLLLVGVIGVFSLILILTPIWDALRRRSVFGSISDDNGHPLELARVELRNLRTLEVLVCVTDEWGRFHFNGVSATADCGLAVVHDGDASRAVTIWPNACDRELHLQFEPVESFADRQVLVMQEEVADVHWFEPC